MEESTVQHNLTQRKKRLIQVLIILSVALILTVGGIFAVPATVRAHRAAVAHRVDPLTAEELTKIDFERAKKLMIVAHPDDDMLWGGSRLLEGGWLVVCVTNGRNETRSAEFRKVMEATDNQGIILEYPDKVNGKRDGWEKVRDGISADLSLVIGASDWEMIVTHNEKGEYGHQHHKMTHTLVLENCLAKGVTDRLWFFGIYHKAKTVDAYLSGEKEIPPDMQTKLSDEVIARKREVLSLYESQADTLEGLSHMIPYENWIPYEG